MVAACEQVGVPLDRIEDITAGCVNTAHEGMGDIARWAALAAGFPDSVPAVTINRFCASSLTGAISIAHAIRSDELGVGLAGGVESMSRSGWAQMKGDAPFSPRGPVLLLDTMWAGAGGPPNPALLARNAYVEMIKTAQNVADRYELSREEIDAFALRSHQHAAAAPRLGPPGGRDPSRGDPRHAQGARPDVRARRDHPRRHHSRAAGHAASPAQHHADDRRELLAAQRRRQRGRAGQRQRPPSARNRAAGPGGGVGHLRARPAVHGDRTGLRHRRRPSSGPDWPRRTSTSGRSTRRSRPRHSACCASCRPSSTDSRCPTSASIRTAARWPSATHSGRRGPDTS